MPQMMKIGQVILGRYEVIEPMAEGGQASLARGRDQRTGMDVAIKQVNVDPGSSGYTQALARFERAAKLRIGHRAVVDPFDSGEEDDAHYMVMPFVEGEDLEAYLRRCGGKLAEAEAVALVDVLADALQAIHAQGVVHRDIKPANIRIDRQRHPHVLDLGICKMVSEATITGDTGGLLGSLCWMSPEQFISSGGEDPRSDVYSLGKVFYFMLSGVVPARGNTAAEIAVNTCQQDPIPLRQLVPTLSETVERVCMCALARSPEGRFQSAQEFRQALRGGGRMAPSSRGRLCGFCGGRLDSSAIYCPLCGAHVQGGASSSILCFACGAVVGEAPACPTCRRPFSLSDHRLAFHRGAMAGATFRIPEGIYDVGRGELCPRDGYISRRHLRMHCLNGSVCVEDAGSTNKTYVAGLLAERLTPLMPGLELRVADNAATYSSR